MVCFCCIIRSTGTEHGIFGTDDKPIDIKTITSLFSSDECPSLNGKPKIFVLGFSYFQSQEFKDLRLEDSIKAKRMLGNLVISEDDFLVWNLFDERHGVAERWPERLFRGMPLGDVIESNSSTISTLTKLKDLFFKRK